MKLQTYRIDTLPVLNNYIERCKLSAIFNKELPSNSRAKISPSTVLLFLLRNLLISHFPLYQLGEWANNYEPKLLGLSETSLSSLNDDRIGRCLDQLFLADRASLSTLVTLQIIRSFQIDIKSLHADSTTVSFSGNFHRKQKFTKKSVCLQKGFNKDHRPGVKQLIFNLVVSSDGAVPIHFKLFDGNITDDTTHIETWRQLVNLVGDSNFIYVADSKLCTKDNLAYISNHGGTFITVLPKTRKESKKFRDWIERHPVQTKALWYRSTNPRSRKRKVRYRGYESRRFYSQEGYRILWIWSSEKQKLDSRKRTVAIKKVHSTLGDLKVQLNTYRLKKKRDIRKRVEGLLQESGLQELFTYEIESYQVRYKKQQSPGRPSSKTNFRYVSKTKYRLHWNIDQERLKQKKQGDGFFPLITNEIERPIRDILAFYKYQPHLEKRHSYLKSVLEVAPIYLKSPERIEALLFLFYLALLIYALLERDLRHAMKTAGVKTLPIYPEQRECQSPSAERILETFQNLGKYNLTKNEKTVETFYDSLNSLQKKILLLLNIDTEVYCKK